MSHDVGRPRSRRELRHLPPSEAAARPEQINSDPRDAAAQVPAEPALTRHELRAQERAVVSENPAEPEVPAEAPEASPSDPPVEAAEPAQRSSQVRARNRATLRAYREATDAAPTEASAPAALPSRRLLRQQMRQTEQAPITRINHVVPPAALSVPAAPTVPPSGTSGQPVVRPVVQADPAVQNFVPGASEDHSESLHQDALHHVETLPGHSDPLAVDVEVLAQQKQLAERAAILNERAEARARLAAESADSRSTTSDPTTAHNLAMVTPLQFVKLPGVEKPVLRPPATSHVPVVTSTTPLAAKPIKPPSVPPRSRVNSSSLIAEDADASGEGQRLGRAGVLRRAEKLATRSRLGAHPALTTPVGGTDPEAPADSSPVPARSASGLDPLDAKTAGLDRVQRTRYWQWGIALGGCAALIAGITMIVTTLAR
ncbi:hypothetical protein [Psychromicrobium xiongbiense]|uniref:hypothetical protein n=1 Tax=Psychromicrobium xiongbiense TaxID=3051184 RepID=UPI0025550C59|nr:hypothetical protein [Psychromicrobium sp. YIM S02556]